MLIIHNLALRDKYILLRSTYSSRPKDITGELPTQLVPMMRQPCLGLQLQNDIVQDKDMDKGAIKSPGGAIKSSRGAIKSPRGAIKPRVTVCRTLSVIIARSLVISRVPVPNLTISWIKAPEIRPMISTIKLRWPLPQGRVRGSQILNLPTQPGTLIRAAQHI